MYIFLLDNVNWSSSEIGYQNPLTVYVNVYVFLLIFPFHVIVYIFLLNVYTISRVMFIDRISLWAPVIISNMFCIVFYLFLQYSVVSVAKKKLKLL